VTVSENLDWIVRRAGDSVGADVSAVAEQKYLRFTLESLRQIERDTVDRLRRLTDWA